MLRKGVVLAIHSLQQLETLGGIVSRTHQYLVLLALIVVEGAGFPGEIHSLLNQYLRRNQPIIGGPALRGVVGRTQRNLTSSAIGIAREPVATHTNAEAIAHGERVAVQILPRSGYATVEISTQNGLLRLQHQGTAKENQRKKSMFTLHR